MNMCVCVLIFTAVSRKFIDLLHARIINRVLDFCFFDASYELFVHLQIRMSCPGGRGTTSLGKFVNGYQIMWCSNHI